jgi:replicative DNA helicase
MKGEYERDLTFLANTEEYFRRVEGWQEADVIPTPWPTINRTLGGWGGFVGIGPGWYVVLGGASGAGKSLAALYMATVALKRGRNVGFVSLEMTADQLATRLYSMLCGVSSKHISPGRNYRTDVAKHVRETMEEHRLAGMGKFFTNEARIRDLGTVINVMDAWRDGWNCDLMVVDYMQLCRVPSEEQVHMRIQRTSGDVCDWAAKNDVPVIGISQFHSYARRDRTQPPTMDSLYGGVDLGNDADLMLLLDHSRYHRASDALARTWLIHAKNRHGPSCDDVPVLWNYDTLSLLEATPDEEHLWPGVE